MKKEAILKFYLNFRLYIFPSVVAISSLILIVFVIYPQITKLIQNQQAQNDLLAKSKFLETKAAALENLDEDDLTRKINYVLLAFPTEHDFGSIVGLLQGIARENGFTVTALSVHPDSQTSSSSQKYGVKLDAIGPESQLRRFITAVESSVRIMKVGAIEVGRSSQGNAVSISLDIEVFYAASPTSFGDSLSPLPQLSTEEEALIGTLATFSIPASAGQPASSQPRGKTDPFE